MIGSRFQRLTQRTRIAFDDVVAQLFQQTYVFFLLALGLYAAVLVLQMPERFRDVTGRIALLALFVQAALWGNSLIQLYVRRYKEERLEEDAAAVTSVQALGFVGRLVLWSVVVLLALDNFGVDVTALVAGLGIGGIAVALALQNVLGDLFASLSIVLDKPFVVGDFLIIGDYLGTVEHVGLKTTRIRSLSGEQIVFSNSDLLSSRIRNYKRMQERRVVFSVGVTYQTTHAQLQAIPAMLQEAVEAQEPVRFDRAHFKEFGDSALQFEVVYYVLGPDFNTYMDIQQAINLEIVERFEGDGIEIAYPTRSVYLKRDQENGAAGGDASSAGAHTTAETRLQ